MTSSSAIYGTKCDCQPAGDLFECTCQCGVTIKSKKRHVFHICPAPVEPLAGTLGEPPRPVSLLQKATNFAASLASHVAAGMPQASEEEVARRFAICEGCEHYDGKACKQCGCPVVREKQFISKLAWADQSCPVGKWGPVAGK
jgi:hypothetical protein